MHEGIPILNYLVPKEFLLRDGRLTGMRFEKVAAQYDAKGRRSLVPTGEPDVLIDCDDVLVAVGQENAFPWIERDIGLDFDRWDMPRSIHRTMQSTLPKVFFGGDAAFGPKNIIWAVAHGHEAAMSIDKLLNGEEVADRPPPLVNLVSQKMGIHEWSYDNDVSNGPALQGAARRARRSRSRTSRSRSSSASTRSWAISRPSAASTATCRRCSRSRCASNAMPASTSARWTASPSPRTAARTSCARGSSVPANNLTQDLYVSGGLKTGRVMVKDEDVCLHCGLCAERCPTGAWDMQKFLLEMTQAGPACRSR